MFALLHLVAGLRAILVYRPGSKDISLFWTNIEFFVLVNVMVKSTKCYFCSVPRERHRKKRRFFPFHYQFDQYRTLEFSIVALLSHYKGEKMNWMVWLDGIEADRKFRGFAIYVH